MGLTKAGFGTARTTERTTGAGLKCCASTSTMRISLVTPRSTRIRVIHDVCVYTNTYVNNSQEFSALSGRLGHVSHTSTPDTSQQVPCRGRGRVILIEHALESVRGGINQTALISAPKPDNKNDCLSVSNGTFVSSWPLVFSTSGLCFVPFERRRDETP